MQAHTSTIILTQDHFVAGNGQEVNAAEKGILVPGGRRRIRVFPFVPTQTCDPAETRLILNKAAAAGVPLEEYDVDRHRHLLAKAAGRGGESLGVPRGVDLTQRPVLELVRKIDGVALRDATLAELVDWAVTLGRFAHQAEAEQYSATTLRELVARTLGLDPPANCAEAALAPPLPLKAKPAPAVKVAKVTPPPAPPPPSVVEDGEGGVSIEDGDLDDEERPAPPAIPAGVAPLDVPYAGELTKEWVKSAASPVLLATLKRDGHLQPAATLAKFAGEVSALRNFALKAWKL